MPTTTNDLARIDAQALIAQFGDDYLADYHTIVDNVEKTAMAGKIVSRSARVERFKEAVAKLDRTALAKANKRFKGFLALVRQNADILHSDEPRIMTIVESESVMEEALAIKDMKEALDAEWEAIKERAFAHMTEQFAADGEEFPEHVGGSIDVPALGHRFAREGAGRKEAELNEAALKALVGEDVWNRIIDTETIVVETVSIPKLMAEAKRRPTVLNDLQSALKVGEWKKPKLNVRPL